MLYSVDVMDQVRARPLGTFTRIKLVFHHAEEWRNFLRLPGTRRLEACAFPSIALPISRVLSAKFWLHRRNTSLLATPCSSGHGKADDVSRLGRRVLQVDSAVHVNGGMITLPTRLIGDLLSGAGINHLGNVLQRQGEALRHE
jgi:hypothetical protein